MVADPKTLKKIVDDLEKITIDEEVLEKNSGLLDLISEGVKKLDGLPILPETEPFFFRTVFTENLEKKKKELA